MDNFDLLKNKLIQYFYDFGEEILVKNSNKGLTGMFKDVDVDISLILGCNGVERRLFLLMCSALIGDG